MLLNAAIPSSAGEKGVFFAALTGRARRSGAVGDMTPKGPSVSPFFQDRTLGFWAPGGKVRKWVRPSSLLLHTLHSHHLWPQPWLTFLAASLTPGLGRQRNGSGFVAV